MATYTVDFKQGNKYPVLDGGISNDPLTMSDHAMTSPSSDGRGLVLSARVPSAQVPIEKGRYATTSTMLLKKFSQDTLLVLTLEFDFPTNDLTSDAQAEAKLIDEKTREAEALAALEASRIPPGTKDNLDKAKADFTKPEIVEIDPDDPPIHYLWGVTLVAKTGDETDQRELDRLIAAVCQLRPDGVRLTMPFSHEDYKSAFLLHTADYHKLIYRLELHIDRTDGKNRAKARLTILDPVLGTYEESDWVTNSAWEGDTEVPFPLDVSSAEPTICAVGPSVHIEHGYGLVSARLKWFSVEAT